MPGIKIKGSSMVITEKETALLGALVSINNKQFKVFSLNADGVYILKATVIQGHNTVEEIEGTYHGVIKAIQDSKINNK